MKNCNLICPHLYIVNVWRMGKLTSPWFPKYWESSKNFRWMLKNEKEFVQWGGICTPGTGPGQQDRCHADDNRTTLRPKRKCSPESQQQGAELESACEFSSEPGLLTMKHFQTPVASWMVRIQRCLKSVSKGRWCKFGEGETVRGFPVTPTARNGCFFITQGEALTLLACKKKEANLSCTYLPICLIIHKTPIARP